MPKRVPGAGDEAGESSRPRGTSRFARVGPRFARARPRLVRAATRFLAFVQECLIALGSLWVPPPVPTWAYDGRPGPGPGPGPGPVPGLVPGPKPRPRPRMLDAPPAGHPERLCPHKPMSPAETAIWAGLSADS